MHLVMETKNSKEQASKLIDARIQDVLAFQKQSKFADVERVCREILDQEPAHFDALHLLGVAALKSGQTRRGIELITKAIALNASIPGAHSNLGMGFIALKSYEEALASFEKAITLDPNFAMAHNNRGHALLELNRPAEALASFGSAIALNADMVEAHNNRGLALQSLGRTEEALTSYEKCLLLMPGLAEAHYNRGMALSALNRHEEALASYDKAVALNPNYAEAHNSRGIALACLRQSAKAVVSYDTAIDLKPDFAEAHYNRGLAFNNLNDNEGALAAYDKAFSINPYLHGLEGDRLHGKMQLCNWSNFGPDCTHLLASVRNGNVGSPPFALLGIPSSPAEQLECARSWIKARFPPSDSVLRGERNDHDRLRIGYFSADFHAHATSYLMAQVFECHDKSRFNVTAFSFGPVEEDEMRQRLGAAFDTFINVRDLSDREVATLAKNIQIDIAVDLKGFTAGSRTGIFAHRAAPIQVSYLGYPGTMGADYIDYLIADPILIPVSSQNHFREKIAYLPTSYQANDRMRHIADKIFTRAELGLPETGFVFCCFNSNYKITPDVFDCWMRLLDKVKGSVLWLLEDNATAARNLKNEALARNIAAERLVFAHRISLPEHLARHSAADLFLDTMPCNAHTTASDALWAGLPLVTYLGDTFAGRVAASLLHAIDLPELIAPTVEAYEEIAITLATNSKKLAAIKGKLAANRLETPLFDSKCLTRNIEAAYTAMYGRQQAGLPPDHIWVFPNN